MVVGAGVPVPESATVCGLLLALSVKVRVAVRVPVAVGEKIKIASQNPEAATALPQLWDEIAKSFGSAPETLMLETLIDEEP